MARPKVTVISQMTVTSCAAQFAFACLLARVLFREHIFLSAFAKAGAYTNTAGYGYNYNTTGQIVRERNNLEIEYTTVDC